MCTNWLLVPRGWRRCAVSLFLLILFYCFGSFGSNVYTAFGVLFESWSKDLIWSVVCHISYVYTFFLIICIHQAFRPITTLENRMYVFILLIWQRSQLILIFFIVFKYQNFKYIYIYIRTYHMVNQNKELKKS